MRIVITTDGGRRRRWHERLAQALAADGHQVVTSPGGPAPPEPRGLALLLSFERLVYGSQAGTFFEAVTGEPAAGESAEPDLRIAVGTSTLQGRMAWTVTFDGVPGEAGLIAALLEGRAPVVSLVQGDGALIATGLPALENPRLIGAGLDAVLTRTIGLCRRSVADVSTGQVRRTDSPPAAPGTTSPAALHFALHGLSARIAGRLARLAKTDHRWQTGWRKLQDGQSSVQAALAWPTGGYAWLPDDGQRFYADPFVFTAQGRTVLFVEEYPYATSRGLISAVELTANGPVGQPKPVLDCPVHLSYPSVFERDGTVWMIPETSGNRTIELYRADPFPDRWVLDRVLIDNVSAGDATLLEHGGALYLFAATNDDGGSTWDQLSLFHAPHLHGPWSTHPATPALIDAGSARPAGFCFTHEGALIRPAQDCRGGYGAGLAFCRIDRLDPEVFGQTIIQHLGPDPRWRASGAHTLNVGSGYEVIDRIGPRLVRHES